jgi:preprotein translocase subunit YajC
MQLFILALLILVLIGAAFGYMAYRSNAEKRAQEKRRNQFHDRV